MNELVFLEPNCLEEIPFTTSKIIAENGLVNHHTVTRLIQKYENDLNEFGKVRFQIEALPSGQSEKIYKLNEEQSTLLITFMKNTIPVIKFKKALVKQFYTMFKELNKRKITRGIGKQAREALTNAIQSLPDSPHKSMKYKHYTDLVYKIVFNKNSKQLREEYGISSKDSLRDYFTAGQITDIERLENQIGVLIDLGNDYQFIKMILTKKYLIAI